PPPVPGFVIGASARDAVRTGIVPDAATCPECRREILDPDQRRYRYAFTNCTHCGPRFSIVRRIPYDRAHTSMAGFALCSACATEYADPADRRFHAQPIACPACGPRLTLRDRQGAPVAADDPLATAGDWLRRGRILAIKGIGGYQLVCDAGNAGTVAELRQRKRRPSKPFALMVRDLEILRDYCRVTAVEVVLLQAPAAPIVLLAATGPRQVAPEVAPGLRELGCMLPNSPLHYLLLCDWERPLVVTSGNLSGEPQCHDDAEAHARLGPLVDGFLGHDRAIVNPLDDSVLRVVDGIARPLRRARGYAPEPLSLPPGFEHAPALTALGGELKTTVCLLSGGQAVLSQHLGDLEERRTRDEYRRTLALYDALFEHRPTRRVVDRHPDYVSAHWGRDLCAADGLPLVAVQHHHAHIAACMADNQRPREAGPVLGIALDGLGYGDDGTLWGGEFLHADYASYRRLARLRPIPLAGGVRAILEPWRLAWAQLDTALGWAAVCCDWGDLAPVRDLQARPTATLATMVARGLNAPYSSSCGRLCDAVAALLGLCRERISYEGEAAIALEALADPGEHGGYPFATRPAADLIELDPAALWPALLQDLRAAVPAPVIAARFHDGLAMAVTDLAATLAAGHGLDTVALSGGVFQNARLASATERALQTRGLQVLRHTRVPANDGGLALGQAVVAAARALAGAESAG
ncbi:MAG: carbamoyltransferase HypF, partial [Candidatus Competibacterales bacterium]|nr:carbamoyltransferase HypF [Candidatus Competibacterales bacterium]